MARGRQLRRRRRHRRRQGPGRGRRRRLPDRPDDQHLGVAGRTSSRPPPWQIHHALGPADQLPELRPRQRLPRLRQRHAARRHDDRLGPDRLRAGRQRRGRPRHPGGHPRPARRARTPRREDVLAAVRHPDPRLGRGGDGPRPGRPAPAGPPASSAASRAPAPSTTSCASATSTACAPTPEGLLDAGLALSVATWQEAKAEFDWADMDRYITHQVSQVHTARPVRGPGHRRRAAAADASPRAATWARPRCRSPWPRRPSRSQPGDRVLLHGHRLGPERLLRSRSPGDRPAGPAGRAAGPVRDCPGSTRAWSRRVDARRRGRRTRTWHVLDNGAPSRCTARCCASTATPPGPTCGAASSPQAPAGWRVVAVDQLGMGWSERTATPRTAGAAGRRPRRPDRGARHRPGRSSPSPTTGAARSRSAGPWPTATSCAASS